MKTFDIFRTKRAREEDEKEDDKEEVKQEPRLRVIF
jgi:hypothetical protein